MRVGIMAEFLGTKVGGTATYTRELLRGLAELDTDHEFFAYVASRRGLSHVPSSRTVSARLVAPYAAWLRLTLSLPLELVRRPVDVLHAQGWGPAWSPCPMVLTVHDLSYENDAAAFPPLFRWRLRRVVRVSVRRAARIIASSEHTAQDLIRVYGVAPERIRRIYPAFDPAPFERSNTPAERERVHARYGLRDPYLLYVGSIEPRKNLPALIHAFAEVKRAARVAHTLVIAGRSLRLGDAVLDVPRALGVERDVVFLGPVPQEDLAGLYGGAAAFASLASLEGFGYPPLEAMACGTPVLVAGEGSLPEVVGDAALVVDRKDPAAVARSLERLLCDDGLRLRLRADGPRRACAFDRVAAARAVAAVYDECVPRGARQAAPALSTASTDERP